MSSRNDAGKQQRRVGSLQWRRVTCIALILCVVFMAVFVLDGSRISHALADTNAPSLTVDASSDRHAISQDIYGMNLYGLDANLAKELQLPVQRWGGNNTSRYNWQVDSSNAGDNYFYVGGGDGVYMGGSNPGTGNGVPGASVDRFVNAAASLGSKTMVTVPMVPYINKTSDTNCSYPKSLYPNQQTFSTVTLANGDVCGNGHDASGNHLTDTNIALNNVPNSPDFQKAWIEHLISTHGTTANGGVSLYELDNEPSIWYDTHADIHPDKTGYDELVNTSQAYAQMIKQADPTAVTDGPADFGWCGYIGNCFGKPGDDFTSHGSINLGEYYLQQMHKYEQDHGTRLLDYFDEHYYPASTPNGTLYPASAGSPALQQDRLNSTRSLWDPTYVENNWIGQQYGAINLLPRFHDWINKDYPGTKLAISEYNFGGLESINGALTQADVLGIFGREQVDLATIWGPPTADQPGAYAFRMYRNYDGQGGKYGDTWIKASSSDQSQLAVYGAQRSSDNALTLMVINKTGGDLTSNLALSGATPNGNAQVYTYSSANLNAIVHQPDQAVSSSGLSMTYPANSITLLVIPTNGSTVTPTPTPTAPLFTTSFENGDPQPGWTDTVDKAGYPAGGSHHVTGICCGATGPQAGVRNEATHTGGAALMYAGKSVKSGYAYMKVFDLTSSTITVGDHTLLDYWIYPQSQKSTSAPVTGSNSTCVAIDLIFSASNGKLSNLRDSGTLDQNGHRVHPASQCNRLTLDTWNHVVVNLSTHRKGRQIIRLDVGYDQPGGTGGYRGYIDDISIHG